MAKKKNQTISLPNDVGNDFEDDYNILNFRPVIDFVSPERSIDDPGFQTEPFGEDVIAAQKEKVQSLINDYNAIVSLADIAEQRLDERVASLGGLDIILDTNVDAQTIAAMKRLFPNNPDSKRISYEQYKAALKNITKSAKAPQTYGPLDLRAAQENKYKVDFGSLYMPPGMGRPEISSSAKVIEPINLEDFLTAAIISLFTMLISLITGLIKSVVGI